MELLDKDAVRRWLSQRGLSFDLRGATAIPKCPTLGGMRINVGIFLPQSSLRALMRIVGISGLVQLEFPSGEVLKFTSCDTLITLNEYNLNWNEDPVYVRAMQLLSCGYLGSAQNPFDAYGLSFSADEPIELAAFAMVPLIASQWESYLIPAHGKFFIFTQGGDDMCIVAPRQEDLSGVIAGLDWAKFKYRINPVKKSRFMLDKYTKGTSHPDGE